MTGNHFDFDDFQPQYFKLNNLIVVVLAKRLKVKKVIIRLGLALKFPGLGLGPIVIGPSGSVTGSGYGYTTKNSFPKIKYPPPVNNPCTDASITNGGATVTISKTNQDHDINEILYLDNDYEYYIHAPGTDKRQDVWVDASYLEPTFDIPDDFKKNIKVMENSLVEEAELIRNFDFVTFGRYKISVWYHSPYSILPASEIYVCPCCLLYYTISKQYQQHLKNCTAPPPGVRIFHQQNSDGSVRNVYLVDGKTEKLYCQNLCLLGKLFLDHKTLMYDIDSFVFYVLLETCPGPKRYTELAGFFSKEKHSAESHLLSCIIVFPPHLSKGFGQFLIELSYEIYKIEGKVGGPEGPLSDMGLVGFMRYWKRVLLCLFWSNKDFSMSIKDICVLTGIRGADLMECLQELGLVEYNWVNGIGNDGGLCIPSKMVDKLVRQMYEKDGVVEFKKYVDVTLLEISQL